MYIFINEYKCFVSFLSSLTGACYANSLSEKKDHVCHLCLRNRMSRFESVKMFAFHFRGFSSQPPPPAHFGQSVKYIVVNFLDDQVVFLVKGPIYLVCISCTEEPYESLRGQLELIYGQVGFESSPFLLALKKCFQD